VEEQRFNLNNLFYDAIEDIQGLLRKFKKGEKENSLYE